MTNDKRNYKTHNYALSYQLQRMKGCFYMAAMVHLYVGEEV
jgi:hypothetical protein